MRQEHRHFDRTKPHTEWPFLSTVRHLCSQATVLARDRSRRDRDFGPLHQKPNPLFFQPHLKTLGVAATPKVFRRLKTYNYSTISYASPRKSRRAHYDVQSRLAFDATTSKLDSVLRQLVLTAVPGKKISFCSFLNKLNVSMTHWTAIDVRHRSPAARASVMTMLHCCNVCNSLLAPRGPTWKIRIRCRTLCRCSPAAEQSKTS